MNDIPVKVIKENKDIATFLIHHNFNNSFSSSTFPTALKYTDVRPVFKKDDKTDKENYRPISILPTLSKVYERFIYNQMYPYFDKRFSKFQWSFRKGFNAQHCLITMIEKWHRSVDGDGQAGALLTDLSKAFDCIDHELLIAKLYAYGLYLEILQICCTSFYLHMNIGTRLLLELLGTELPLIGDILHFG